MSSIVRIQDLKKRSQRLSIIQLHGNFMAASESSYFVHCLHCMHELDVLAV